MVTLKARLTLWYSLVWILFVLAFTAVLYFAVKNAVRNEVKDFLRAEAQEVPQSFVWTTHSFHIDNFTPWLELEHQVNSDYAVFLQVLADSARVIKRSDNLVNAGQFLPTAPIAEKNTGTFVEIAQNGLPFFLYYHPVHDTTGSFVGWMQTAAYEQRVTTFLQVLSDWLLLGMLAALVPCVLVGWWMARQALSPLQDIAGMAASITSEKLDTRIPAPKTKSTEIVQLVSALNALLQRLENAFQRVSQFTSDAAHELMTPLTSLHSDVEITLRREREASEYAGALQRVRADAGHMVEIVRNLLFLARADREHTAPAMSPLDPSTLLQDTLDDFAPQIYAKALQLDMDSAPAQVRGNETLLRQLFANLIKNAITYCDANARLTVKTFCVEKEWRCEIGDTGIGIPTGMHDKIFERFCRLDESRQRDTSGAGLGLSIAREIARQHHGEVALQWSEPGKGSLFVICLPFESTS